MQKETKDKISNIACNKDIRYTHNGSIIFHTDNLECAIEICIIKLFMGLQLNAVWYGKILSTVSFSSTFQHTFH